MKRPSRRSYPVGILGLLLGLFGISYFCLQAIAHFASPTQHLFPPSFSSTLENVLTIAFAVILIVGLIAGLFGNDQLKNVRKPDKADIYFATGVVIAVGSIIVSHFWK